MLPTVGKYFRIWQRAVISNFTNLSTSRIDFVTFVTGKLLHLGFFFLMIMALFDHTPTIAGYNRGEVLLFFGVTHLVHILVQMFWFRGMTDLMRLIKRGDFDFVLVKPMSPLFWTSFRMFDFFDIATLPFGIWYVWFAVTQLSVTPDVLHWVMFVVVFLVSLFVAFSVNLILTSLHFWTTEMHNAWWLYRELVYAARIPPDIFPAAARAFFVFVIPIILISAFPTKALLGTLQSFEWIWIALAPILFGGFAALIWRKALARYASASS